jgi:hypothetical protein
VLVDHERLVFRHVDRIAGTVEREAFGDRDRQVPAGVDFRVFDDQPADDAASEERAEQEPTQVSRVGVQLLQIVVMRSIPGPNLALTSVDVPLTF